MECVSDSSVRTYEFKWKIQKLTDHMQQSKQGDVEIQSDPFSVDGDNTKWHLNCIIKFTRRIIDGFKPYNEFYFHIVCDNLEEEQEVRSTIASSCIRNGTTKPEPYKEYKFTEEKRSAQIADYREGFLQATSAENADDDLVFICKFEVKSDTITSAKQFTIPNLQTNCASYLAELLANEKFSDVIFVINGEKLKAHKGLLATRSPIFAAMFEYPLKEQSQNEIVINDVDSTVFKQMLQYIYTNEVDGKKCKMIDLLYVADKYGLEELKKICEESLRKEINIDNAIEIFNCALHHNLNSLLESAKNFIDAYIIDIIQTDAYQQLKKENLDLAMKFFNQLLKSVITKK